MRGLLHTGHSNSMHHGHVNVDVHRATAEINTSFKDGVGLRVVHQHEDTSEESRQKPSVFFTYKQQTTRTHTFSQL